MRLGAVLVIRGSVFGCLVVAMFTFFVTSGASFQTQDIQSTPLEVNSSTTINTIVECNLSTKYPDTIQRWCDLITKYSSKHDLPPDLIAALIWQESGGKSKAYSKSGAVGLMQVMPRDGLAASFMCKNGPCFSNRPTIDQLQDAEFNLKYGTRMLSGLVRRHGTFREALKAYGPMDVGYYYADIVLNIYRTYKN